MGLGETVSYFRGLKSFRRPLLALHSLCIRILDIGCFEDIFCIGTYREELPRGDQQSGPTFVSTGLRRWQVKTGVGNGSYLPWGSLSRTGGRWYFHHHELLRRLEARERIRRRPFLSLVGLPVFTSGYRE